MTFEVANPFSCLRLLYPSRLHGAWLNVYQMRPSIQFFGSAFGFNEAIDAGDISPNIFNRVLVHFSAIIQSVSNAVRCLSIQGLGRFISLSTIDQFPFQY
jgi:hypothetical protein